MIEERGRKAVIELPNSAHPVAALEILAILEGAHTPLTALIRSIPGLQTTLAISPLSLPLLLHRSALSVTS